MPSLTGTTEAGELLAGLLLNVPRMAMAFPRWTNGASVMPWKEGRALVWDATCPDTLAHSYQISVRKAGSVAAEAELLNSITIYIILMSTQLSPTL